MTDNELDAWIETYIFGNIVLDEYPYRPRGQKGLRENEILTEEATRQHYEHHRYQCMSLPSVRPFTTDIAEAWKVIEKLRKDGFTIGLMDYINAGWQCRLGHHEGIDIWATGPSAAKAICLAARKATDETTYS